MCMHNIMLTYLRNGLVLLLNLDTKCTIYYTSHLHNRLVMTL